jgi:hypothetical protein
MEVRGQKSYQDLKLAIEKAIENKANLLIVTIPGTGMARFLNEIRAEMGPKLTIKVLNLDWANFDEAINKAEAVMNSLALGDRILITVNYPALLADKRLTSASWWNHFYQRYYFGVRDEEDSLKVISELKPAMTEAEAGKIYQLSGGIVQIMKYLALNGGVAGEGLEAVVGPIVRAVLGTNVEIRQKLDLVVEGTVLEEYLKGKEWPIRIDFELNLIEDGVNTGKLALVEAEVLRMIMENGGKITKEEVAEIKWGKDKYDEFSDQAINKAIRRLDEKLQKHVIETIPKVGFILKKR